MHYFSSFQQVLHEHTVYIVLTYFASFTGYKDDTFEVISNLHVQGSIFGGKFELVFSLV